MKLPHFQNAFIDIQKLRDYSLNQNHSRGKHKARLFAAILDLQSADADILEEIIRNAINQEEAILGMQDQYGQRYTVDFEITRNQNTAPVRTTWIIRLDEDFPRLTSCFIVRKR